MSKEELKKLEEVLANDRKIIEDSYKEIERLNNIIEVYKNANEYHQNTIHELETMKQPNQLHSENVKLRAENNRLNNIIKDIEYYINFLVIYNQTINGKFSETQWGQDILGLMGSD